MTGTVAPRGRRSLFIDAMSLAAGLWLGLAGGAVAGAGCEGSAPAGDDMTAPDGPVVKYGGPPDAAVPDAAVDMPVVKYGGPPDQALPVG